MYDLCVRPKSYENYIFNTKTFHTFTLKNYVLNIVQPGIKFKLLNSQNYASIIHQDLNITLFLVLTSVIPKCAVLEARMLVGIKKSSFKGRPKQQ